MATNIPIYTKDGRIFSNGRIVSKDVREVRGVDTIVYVAVMECGNDYQLTKEELNKYFYTKKLEG